MNDHFRFCRNPALFRAVALDEEANHMPEQLIDFLIAQSENERATPSAMLGFIDIHLKQTTGSKAEERSRLLKEYNRRFEGRAETPASRAIIAELSK
jgi:hypothetical protein